MTALKDRLLINGRRRIVVLAVAALVVVGALIALASLGGVDGRKESLYFAAERGPLTISVTESGTIKAREQVVLKNEVEGRTTIIYIISEGTHVEEGELLVELDSSQMQDLFVEQEIRVQNLEADVVRAREGLEVTRSQADSDISRAELDYRFAQEDLQKYVEGDFPKDKMQAENRITIAEEELKRAEERVTWSRQLYAEKYISKTDLEADELSLTRAKLDLDLANQELDLLKTYTYTRQIAELESNVDQTREALERVKRKGSADIVQAEADLRARQAEYKRQQEQLAKAAEQLEKTKIYAPRTGMVIYATTGQGNWRGNEEPLEEGSEVREREELIYLPTANSVMADIKIHESALELVKVGQPVRVTADALPGRTFWGRVAKISPLPDAQSMWMNPDLKVYATEIHLDGSLEEIRTGMSCRAEIIVDQYDNVVYVPIQSVLRIPGQGPTVYIRKTGGLVERPVKIGLDNNDYVHVIEGLEPGEQVAMAPPLDKARVGDRPGMDDQEGRIDVPEIAAVDTPGPRQAQGGDQQFPGAPGGRTRGQWAEGAGQGGPRGAQGGPGAGQGRPQNAESRPAGAEGRQQNAEGQQRDGEARPRGNRRARDAQQSPGGDQQPQQPQQQQPPREPRQRAEDSAAGQQSEQAQAPAQPQGQGG